MDVSARKPQISVMLVDDSSFMRKALERIIQSNDDMIVCESACSGEVALEKLDAAQPDVITMDVEMPGMGGLAAVKAIMARRHVPIIMLSSLTDRGSETTLQALENGAVDFVAKPSGGVMDIHRISSELIAKIRTFARRVVLPPAVRKEKGTEETSLFVAKKPRSIRCIAIGISTGGPAALTDICGVLSANIKIPILIVQHMPVGFTKALAERLHANCALEVLEATDQMTARPGQVIIGPAGKQMRVKNSGDGMTIVVSANQGDSLYAPSADVLFSSVAEECGRYNRCIHHDGHGQ